MWLRFSRFLFASFTLWKAGRLPLILLGGLCSSTLGYAQISGTVYFDGNNDGTKQAAEAGYGGITITAYNMGGTSAGTAVSANDGTYSLTGLAAGNYRVEFSSLSNGLYPAALGTSSNSQVQFVTNGSSNVNFGVYQGSNFISSVEPRVIISCALAEFWANRTSAASWDYGDRVPLATNTIIPHTDDFTADEIGVPNGFAVRLSDKKVFSTPLSTDPTQTNSMFPPAPDGAGAVYMLDYSGAGFTKVGYKLLVNLATYVNINNQSPAVAGTTTDYYGERGLSGIELSPDGKTLYVVNMGSGKLVQIDISGVNYASLPTTAPTAAQISEITIPSALTNPSNGYFRPSALTRRGSALYLGGINDGSSGSNADLKGLVLKYDLSTLTWTKVLEFEPDTWLGGTLNGTVNKPQGKWQAHGASHIQPYFSDIAFDDTDAMILGISDREAVLPSTTFQTGYVVRTCRDTSGNYSLESGGNCAPFTTAARAAFHGGGNMAPTDGPGGGYFFEQSMFSHAYVFSGGLYIKSGTNELFGGAGDPVDYGTFGARIWDWRNGQVMAGANTGGIKIANLIGMDAVGEPAPIEIGNRVWLDTDYDGLQDAGEAGIAGVTVELRSADGTTLIATATTDPSGNYIFSSDTARSSSSSHLYSLALSPNTAYLVRFPTTATVAATSYNLTTQTAGANRLIDSNPANTGDAPVLATDIPVYGANNHSFDAGYSTPPCTINNFTVTPACNNNGTPANATDDYRTFSVTASGTGIAATYTAAVNNSGTLTPTTGSYGSATNFRLQDGSAGNGTTYTLTLTDASTSSCTQTTSINDTGSCGVTCSINTPTVSATCNNNGTASDPSDDTFTFTISTTGSNTGANYKVEKTSPAPTSTVFASLSYGTTSAASSSFPISGGNLTLTLTDNTTSTCTLAPVTVTAPPTCSTGGGGQPDLKIAKTSDKASVSSGQTITYTVTLINEGSASATGVQVRDLLPSAVTFVSATPSQGTYNNATGIWNVGSVSVGASLTLTIQVTVN